MPARRASSTSSPSARARARRRAGARRSRPRRRATSPLKAAGSSDDRLREPGVVLCDGLDVVRDLLELGPRHLVEDDLVAGPRGGDGNDREVEGDAQCVEARPTVLAETVVAS